tara:strand:+ start:3798 stop:3962 length:165 start_codon:yes stop_codon:yes gene_type:complete
MIDILLEIIKWLLVLSGIGIILSGMLLPLFKYKEKGPGKFDKQGVVSYNEGDNT